MEEIRQYYKFRPDEIFRRITVTSMVTLMLEVSKLEYQEEDSHRLDNQIREDQESLLLQGQKVEEKANETLEDEGQNDLQEEDEKEVEEEGLEVDSLDSAIDPEEHRRSEDLDDDPDMIDSIVFKGKKIRKGGGFNSHHFSSVGNLLQVILKNLLRLFSSSMFESSKKHRSNVTMTSEVRNKESNNCSLITGHWPSGNKPTHH